MTRLLLLVFGSLAVATALPAVQSPINQALVDEVNTKNAGWTAKLYPRFAQMSEAQLKQLMGGRRRSENPNWSEDQLTPVEPSNDEIPESFDAREAWPNCKEVISTIPDQSSCGSCWAVSSASVMSDRVCIGSNGTNKTPISSKDIISCCGFCGYGCEGGWPDQAFAYWRNKGVVSGSSFKLDQGCQPYPFAECEHHSNKTTYSPCPAKMYDTPSCSAKCQTSFVAHQYRDDKYFGSSEVKLRRNVASIQREVMKNGPMVFTFSVYADFPGYSSGVYRHTSGKYLGGHAVRVIGWGTENDTKYWLIANSWNEDWGDKGYFKIVRGINNCGIEDDVVAGVFDMRSAPSAQ